VTVNNCTGVETWCYAELEVMGQAISGNCDDLEEQFGFEDIDDEECETEIMQERGDCMDDIAQYVDGMTECFYEASFDLCIEEELHCHAMVVVHGESYEGTCDELSEQFNIPEEDDDHECEAYQCEEEYDCKDEFIDKVDHCKKFMCVNSCTHHEECMIEFRAKDGQEGRVDCETFFMHMEDDHHDDDHHDDDDCGIMEEEYDCMDMAAEHVEFMDECTFVEKYDVCRDEVIECMVTVKIMGEKFEGDCQEIAE
jgi:hypothetical protein